MISRHGFGPYTPDLPPIVNQKGVTIAKNVVPISGGYGPLPSLSDVAGATALDARCRGALGGIDSGGNAYNFAGDASKLYRQRDVGVEDVSISTGYTSTIATRWEFVIFGDVVIATNFNEPMQYYTLHTSTAFQDLVVKSENPGIPKARHIGVIDRFLVAGNIFDANGVGTNVLSWSAVGNPFGWPERGTDLAVSVQSDNQQLEGPGGRINAVVSGAEVGAIFQEHAIWRMDYRGGDVVFELNRVEPNRGLLVPGLALPVGRFVFYLSEDGFYLFDYTSSTPIGKDRVNKTFLADLDDNYFHRVSVRRHPDQTRIFVLYPGAGNVLGTPNRLLIYDWALNQFSFAEVTAELLTEVVTPSVTLDSGSDPDDVDAVGEPSFDARVASDGTHTLGAYSSSNVLQSFTGTSLVGTIETGDLELAPGGRSFVSGVRPLVDAVDATVQIAAMPRRNSPVSFGRVSPQDDDGSCPTRVDGRYHRLRVNLPSGWDNAVGVDVEFRPSGTR